MDWPPACARAALKPRPATDIFVLQHFIVSRLVRAFAVACCLQACAHAAPLEVHDDRGKTLRLVAPATRIISIAPHLTEIAFAAGVGSRLIAVSEYSDYPPDALRLPRVGDGARVDIERILMLKPDLVLAWKSGNQAGDIAKLERLGISVWVSEASRLHDIPRLLRGVAVVAGEAAAGERVAAEFEQALRKLRERHSTQMSTQMSTTNSLQDNAQVRATAGALQPLRVFYEIWHQPLLTVNSAHMISDAIKLCGGHNVFADAAVLTPSVSLESVLAVRPHIVLGGGSANGESEFRSRWERMPLAALRSIPARYIAPDSIQRQSPRVLDGIRAMCSHLDSARAHQNGSLR
jgi:iron complex transport system substrate-binding protein